MVAWYYVTMKTHECPEGSNVVFIANDVLGVLVIQIGSFGVEDDELYGKASVYTCDRK